MSGDAPDQIGFLKKAGMPLTTESLVTYTELVTLQRLGLTQLADFIPGVKPYEVATTVELETIPQGVRLVLTLDAMHDEQWTRMAVMGWESELGQLAQGPRPVSNAFAAPRLVLMSRPSGTPLLGL